MALSSMLGGVLVTLLGLRMVFYLGGALMVLLALGCITKLWERAEEPAREEVAG